ncbi:HAD family hydrolase [Desulfobacca acetoxidans]
MMVPVSDKAAIFDVDRTLIGVPTERLFFGFLIWRKKIAWRQATRYFQQLIGNWEDRYTNKSYLQGLAVREVDSLADDCYRSLIRPRLSPKGLTCLKDHRRQRHRIVVLTGSLECLMAPLQRDLDADWLIATKLETAGECYTGRISGAHPRGKHKLELLQDLARRNGIDLSVSTAYADHSSDLPLLLHIGRPVVVNPSFRLLVLARRRRWPICRF